MVVYYNVIYENFGSWDMSEKQIVILCDRKIYDFVIDYSVTYAKFDSLVTSENKIVIIYDSLNPGPGTYLIIF